MSAKRYLLIGGVLFALFRIILSIIEDRDDEDRDEDIERVLNPSPPATNNW